MVNEKALDEYLEFYENFVNAEEKHRYIYKEDLEELNGMIISKDELKDYTVDRLKNEKRGTCVMDGLVPEPFLGNVRYNEGKKVYLILSNPGFYGTEYFEQWNIDGTPRDFQEVLFDAMKRDNKKIWEFDYKFYKGKNNDSCKIGTRNCSKCTKGKAGANWWIDKIDQGGCHLEDRIKNESNFLNCLSKARNESREKALDFFSSVFCNIEVLPYHSYSFSSFPKKTLDTLEAFKKTKKLIEEYLIPLAIENEDVMLIFARAKTRTIFKKTLESIKNMNCKNILIYKCPSRRFSLFSVDGKNLGETIIEHLKK